MKGLGFGAEIQTPKQRKLGELLREVQTEDLLQVRDDPRVHRPAAGGRDARGARRGGALISILTEPKNALVKQYQKLFEFEGVRLRFTEGALARGRAQGARAKSGARGLRAILENMMLEI